jgi:transcriptional regulator with PAS, ATPase and Fis domain
MELVQQRPSDTPLAPTILGASAAMQRLLTISSRIAARQSKVLITGETGVGKDVIARYIHAHSTRTTGRYVALNCASFSEALLESELFGHVKGSFTGAYRDKIGKLQQAHRGTIFLDEIGEMTLRMQALLLRFLEDGEIQPVGSDEPPIRSDVRVISATNRDLQTMVSRGEFREDLLFRIRVSHIQVPPLRDRTEDVPALVTHAIEKTGRRVTVSDDAMELLTNYRWPGNVRELQNVVEQMIAVSASDEIGVADLPPSVAVVQGTHLYPQRERRRRVADELYDALVTGRQTFWGQVYEQFMSRDLTRADLRQLVKKGLATTGGNYRATVQLFGIGAQDYKKFLNFLASHECAVDYREYRAGHPQSARLSIAPSGEPRALAG